MINKKHSFIFQFRFSLKNWFYLPAEMELENNSELKNETRCVIKFCNSLGIRVPETVKLIKKDYKVNFLMILRFLDGIVINKKLSLQNCLPYLACQKLL